MSNDELIELTKEMWDHVLASSHNRFLDANSILVNKTTDVIDTLDGDIMSKIQTFSHVMRIMGTFDKSQDVARWSPYVLSMAAGIQFVTGGKNGALKVLNREDECNWQVSFEQVCVAVKALEPLVKSHFGHEDHTDGSECVEQVASEMSSCWTVGVAIGRYIRDTGIDFDQALEGIK